MGKKRDRVEVWGVFYERAPANYGRQYVEVGRVRVPMDEPALNVALPEASAEVTFVARQRTEVAAFRMVSVSDGERPLGTLHEFDEPVRMPPGDTVSVTWTRHML